MSLLDQILGNPFVYKHVRPLAVGGLDMSQVFEPLDVRASDTILDVGCGTGVALEHLPAFKRYYGFDTDTRALEIAKQSAAERSEETTLAARQLTLPDVEAIQPDIAILSGLLHHLDDAACLDLLGILRQGKHLREVVTFDVTFFPGEYFGNLLTVFDRGQYARRPEGYVTLAEKSGFSVTRTLKVPAKRSGSFVHYWLMVLTPSQ